MRYLIYQVTLLTLTLSINRLNGQGGVFIPESNICQAGSWKLVFHDEFNGNDIDRNKWFTYFPYGPNQSDQVQFARTHSTEVAQQIFLDQNVTQSNGTAKIQLKREQYTWMGSTQPYTAGLLHSKQEFFTYGKYEIRCKIPAGRGFWPAFWMFGWSTEFDVFEFGGQAPNKPYSTLHKWLPNNHRQCGGSYTGQDYSTSMHVFGMIYEPNYIRFYVDGVPMQTIWRYSNAGGYNVAYCDVPTGVYYEHPHWPRYGDHVQVIASCGLAKFDDDCDLFNSYGMECLTNNISSDCKPFGLRSPDNTTPFPSTFEIDYIRVYQKVPQQGLIDICGTRRLAGPSLLCGNQQATFIFEGANVSNTTWTVSPNLRIINLTPNSVVVEATNSTVVGQAWIKADNNYEGCTTNTFTKNIWIGKPSITSVVPITTNCDPCFELNPVTNSLSSPIYSYTFNGSTQTVNYYCANTARYRVPYSLVATNSCGTSSMNGTAIGNCVNGRPKNLVIYPNPAKEVIFVKADLDLDLKNAKFYLSDIKNSSTEEISYNSYSEGVVDFDVSVFPSGLYNLTIVPNDIEMEPITELITIY